MLCGEAAEFLLKAFVMRTRRLNSWPERDPELHTHDIRKLIVICGISSRRLTPAQVAAFAKAMEWNRFHDYNPSVFPQKDAKDIFEAVFGKEGVSQWIRSNI
jgi:site-specific recombinase